MDAEPSKRKSGHGITILVVEDDPVTRHIVSRFLQLRGYAIVEAHEANEAVKILENNLSVRVVFTDVVLPGELNGCDLADRIYKNYPKLPVILGTGHGLVGLVAERFPQYCTFVKPYNMEELMEHILSVVG